MAKEYREELAAAHARIAQLEAQLAEKTAAAAATDPKIAKLETQRALIVRTSTPTYLRKFAVGSIAVLTLAFGLVGLLAWAVAGALPSELGMVFGIGGLGLFIGLLVGVLQLFLAPVTARRQIEQIDQELAEARRIAKLESDIAEMRRVRVGVEPAAETEEEDAEEAKRAER
jgi:hypothetical protein